MAKKTVKSKAPTRKAQVKAKTKKAAKRAKPIPDGYHVVTAGFRAAGCAKAIDFLQSAFGARIKDRYDGPGGVVYHAELRIGDSVLMCGDPQPGYADAFPLMGMLYVKDSDAVLAKAVGLGATIVRPIQDQFYGDRSGTVRDLWGNEWTISTHKEDVNRKEMKRRMAAMMEGG